MFIRQLLWGSAAGDTRTRIVIGGDFTYSSDTALNHPNPLYPNISFHVVKFGVGLWGARFETSLGSLVACCIGGRNS